MLPVSFENARAEELFLKAVKTTYGQEKNVKRVGFPGLSLYSRNETVAWNANCNDHLRKLDKDGNLFITQQRILRSYSIQQTPRFALAYRTEVCLVGTSFLLG
jgi:hypothetical protein